MNILAALFLLIGTQAYVAPTPDGQWQLYTQDGTFAIELGSGCDWIQEKTNVDYIGGSAGVATLFSINDGLICNTYTTGVVSDAGCFTNTDLICDVDADLSL